MEQTGRAKKQHRLSTKRNAGLPAEQLIPWVGAGEDFEGAQNNTFYVNGANVKLEKRLRDKIRVEGKHKDTADCYWRWVVRFMKFAKSKRGVWVDPATMGRHQVEVFLTHLAVKENVAPSTQDQALAALCYLYNVVLEQPLENVKALRAKKAVVVRQVLDQEEVVMLLRELSGRASLAAKMMYAAGFRIGELGRLRIKDVDFKRRQINVQVSAPSPIDALKLILANPQIAAENQRIAKEPHKLRIFAG